MSAPLPEDLIALLQTQRRLPPEAVASLLPSHAPMHRLAVYGTLMPGGANHGLLAGMPGTWQGCFLRGRHGFRQYPVFTWNERGALVAAALLTSAALPLHWARLDAFEGEHYRRILAPVYDAGGHLLAIANVYEAVVPVG